jgi:8-oxo-dGTP pyrophosphatase MutT (NUDIX family)
MAPKIVSDADKVFDVFQPGLRRGAERLSYDPRKRYFYVEHPEEGWRVYLRSACFLHELFKPFQADRFLVVKRTGAETDKASWEAPKGQMEGKDAGRDTARQSIEQLLKENIRREVEEEAKISRVRELNHTGLVLQSVEPDFPPNTYFQYHIFSGYVHPLQIEKAFNEFLWLADHPDAFRRLRSDRREKDDIGWYNEGTKKMMGRWSPTLVKMYLGRFKG